MRLIALGSVVALSCSAGTPSPPTSAGDGAASDGAQDTAVARDAAAADGALPGLLAAYHFDEGDGTVAVDWSGNFRNGGLIGGVSWGTGRRGGDASLDGVGGYLALPPD